MIEQTYSKHIVRPGADLVRGAMLDLDQPAPVPGKVVKLHG
jgi:hypothetical protein